MTLAVTEQLIAALAPTGEPHPAATTELAAHALAELTTYLDDATTTDVLVNAGSLVTYLGLAATTTAQIYDHLADFAARLARDPNLHHQNLTDPYFVRTAADDATDNLRDSAVFARQLADILHETAHTLGRLTVSDRPSAAGPSALLDPEQPGHVDEPGDGQGQVSS